MKKHILVAGGTGTLGEKIINALLKKGAGVRMVVRKESDESKLEKFSKAGVEVIKVDFDNINELSKASENVSCVVSALAGLKDVIIDAQSALLDAAVNAGVPRFIPSDFSIDFTKYAAGENRNFDLRRDFHAKLEKSQIKATSIFNGAFAEILAYGTPLLETKKKFVGYWGDDPNWYVDYTTMDDTAAFTAAAALDNNTPSALHIASFQPTPLEFSIAAKEITGSDFHLLRMGSLEEFAAKNKKDRLSDPESETNLYSKWQNGQYMHDMFISHHESIDNNRYPELTWTTLNKFLKNIL